MRRWRFRTLALTALLISCNAVPPSITAVVLPVETEFFLLNLSRQWYATIALRPAGGAEDAYAQSKLIPPGAVFRERFLELFPQTGGCPDRLDLRVYLYKRVNDDVPIGEDPGERVGPQPVASGEILDVGACELVVVSTYTIVLRDSEEGVGVIKAAQATSGAQIRTFEGVNLPDPTQVPEMLEAGSLGGRVIAPDGSDVANVGVLLRTRFRVNDDDCDICPYDPECVDYPQSSCHPQCFCYSDPIAVTATDADGRFSFDRPPGAYWVEAFADGLLFGPVWVEVESPIDNITIVAETEP